MVVYADINQNKLYMGAVHGKTSTFQEGISENKSHKESEYEKKLQIGSEVFLLFSLKQKQAKPVF